MHFRQKNAELFILAGALKVPFFPYYNPGYYLKKNYFGVGIIKGKGLFKGGIIF